MLKAVDGVSFSLYRGEVLGLVGESGCGKSLTALSIMRLLPKGVRARTVHGQVLLGGDDLLLEILAREMRDIRGRRISMILQDPRLRSTRCSASANNCARRSAAARTGPRGDAGGGLGVAPCLRSPRRSSASRSIRIS